VKKVFFLLNVAFAMAILALISRVHIASGTVPQLPGENEKTTTNLSQNSLYPSENSEHVRTEASPFQPSSLVPRHLVQKIFLLLLYFRGSV
jgi:hypothetical protein